MQMILNPANSKDWVKLWIGQRNSLADPRFDGHPLLALPGGSHEVFTCTAGLVYVLHAPVYVRVWLIVSQFRQRSTSPDGYHRTWFNFSFCRFGFPYLLFRATWVVYVVWAFPSYDLLSLIFQSHHQPTRHDIFVVFCCFSFPYLPFRSTFVVFTCTRWPCWGKLSYFRGHGGLCFDEHSL